MSNFPNSLFSTTASHGQQESGADFLTSVFTSSSHSTRSDSPLQGSHSNDFYNSGLSNYCEVTSHQNDSSLSESAGANGFDFSNSEINLLGEWATDPFRCLTLNQKEETESNQSEDEEYNQLEETESNQPEDKESNQLYVSTHGFQSSVKDSTHARGTHTWYARTRTHVVHPQGTHTWSSQGTSNGGATFCRPDSSDDSSTDDEDSGGPSNQCQSVVLISAFAFKNPKKVCKMLLKILAKHLLPRKWAAAVHFSLDSSAIIINFMQGNYIACAFDAFFFLIDAYHLLNQSEASKESQRILYEKVCQVVRDAGQSPDLKQANSLLKDAAVNWANHLYEKLTDELGRSFIERFKEFMNDKAKTPIRSLVDGPEALLDDFVGQTFDSICEKCTPQAKTETVGAEDSRTQEFVRMLSEFGAAVKFLHFLLKNN